MYPSMIEPGWRSPNSRPASDASLATRSVYGCGPSLNATDPARLLRPAIAPAGGDCGGGALVPALRLVLPRRRRAGRVAGPTKARRRNRLRQRGLDLRAHDRLRVAFAELSHCM